MKCLGELLRQSGMKCSYHNKMQQILIIILSVAQIVIENVHGINAEGKETIHGFQSSSTTTPSVFLKDIHCSDIHRKENLETFKQNN